MEQWEFLLQKEGDRSWLPLESPAVEILEGRYRVVARSGRPSEAVAIRITHQDLEEFPPKRRVHKRTTEISPEGLLLMIPFTRLKPGIWELQCTNETTPENPDPIWQHAMRLMVLPADAYSDSDLEPETPEAEDAEALYSPTPPETPAVATVPVTPGAIITNAGVRLPIAPYAQESPSVPRTLPPLTLSLERDTYVVAWGGQFNLAGQVEVLSEGEIPPISGLELHVSLRDPQTGKILAQVRQELPEEEPPLFFTCPVAIGAECRTHLILGEVNICRAGVADPQGEEKILASQSLTIVADVDNLMEIVPEGLSEEDILEFSPETLIRQEAEALDKSFEDLRSTIKNSPPLRLQPAVNPVLPPLLNQPGREPPPKPKFKYLDLPSLGRRTPENPPPPRQNTTAAPPTPPTGEGNPAPTSFDLQETPPDELPLPAADVASSPFPEEVVERQPPPPNPVDAAFQGLHLRERFLSRLSALAGDRELSEWLQANVSQATPKKEEPAALEAQQAPEPKAMDWEAREIVVDDEPLEVATPYQSGGLVAVPPMGLVLPEDQAVPEPRLQVKGGELVAGRMVEVAVQLPVYQPTIPIYVKLWLRDRQSRQLLDGPHWLTQFWPTGMGDVEGKIQLMVPKGTLEVQLEAIAVEAQTQRESRKATIERPVAPPPLPSLPEYNSEA